MFYDRIEEESERKGSFPEHVLLGHIMAHEMGHLFLGPGSHSGRGIMRFPWQKADLERASRGGLENQPLVAHSASDLLAVEVFE